MLNLIKENWIWIVAPILVVAVIVGWMLFFAEKDPNAPFTYNIF